MSSDDPTVARLPVHRAVVPAAGLGTRLRPLTNIIPKELLPIGPAPVLAHVVAELRAAGITHALFVVSERKPQIRSFFGDLYTGENESLPPLQCEYVLQQEQRGSGHALLCAADWAQDQPFVVAFGDCLIDSPTPAEPLRRLMATHRSLQADAVILVEAVARDQVSRYGVVAPAYPVGDRPMEPFAMAGIVEKPRVEEAPSSLVVAARWVLEPSIFALLRRGRPDARGEINIPDAIQALLQDGGTAWAVPLRADETRRDIGNMESFCAEFVRAALRDPRYGSLARSVAEATLNCAQH